MMFWKRLFITSSLILIVLLQFNHLIVTAGDENELSSPTLSPTLAHQLGLRSRSPTHAPTAATGIPTSGDPLGVEEKEPSFEPTKLPIFPSSQPTGSPTLMPTHSGVLGRDWWYIIESLATIMIDESIGRDGDSPAHTEDELLGVVQDAFEFVLTDNLLPEEGEKHLKAEVHAYIIAEEDEDQKLKQQYHHHYHDLSKLHDSAEDISIFEFRIKAWVWKESIMPHVYHTMNYAAATPVLILEPIHQAGLEEVFNVTITEVKLKSKTEEPPSTENGLLEEIFDDPDEKDAPEGITFIIIGTLILFACGVCILGNACSKDCVCTYECIRSRIISFSRCIYLLCLAFRFCLLSICSTEEPGFELASQDEEIDDELDEEYHSGSIEMTPQNDTNGNTYARPPEQTDDSSLFDSRTV